jgi:hypothetical protein
MKPQPFNLELWLHLGKPDCVWTRGLKKVRNLMHHADCNQDLFCLSGVVDEDDNHKNSLHIWTKDGISIEAQNSSGWITYHGLDIMLHLEDKPLTFGIKKK